MCTISAIKTVPTCKNSPEAVRLDDARDRVITPGCSFGWRWNPHHLCKAARWQTGSMSGKTPTRRQGTCLREGFPQIVQCGRTSSFALAPSCSPGGVKELAEAMSLGATRAGRRWLGVEAAGMGKSGARKGSGAQQTPRRWTATSRKTRYTARAARGR